MGTETSVTKDDLINKFTGYAQAIAYKVAQTLPIEIEDAVSLAHLGLVEAANRFDFGRYDPTKPSSLDTNFKSFAFQRIRGAIIDGARKDSFVRRRGLEKGIRFDMTSLDDTRINDNGESGPAFEIPFFDDPDEMIDLLDAFDDLDEREKAIVVGVASGYSGRELADRFGITQSRVSQLNARAKAKISQRIHNSS